MTLREYSAMLSAITVIVGTVWYIYLALRGKKVKLVLAAWIINGLATALSFLTYMTAPKHSIISNAYNFTSVLTINSILVTAIVVMRREKSKLSFNQFQKWCLGATAFITILWIVMVWGLGQSGAVPNILLQIMMTIGYVVIGQRLWNATSNTESLFAWWCIVVASSAGLTTALISYDLLASVFSGRTLLGSLAIVLLSHRSENSAEVSRSS